MWQCSFCYRLTFPSDKTFRPRSHPFIDSSPAPRVFSFLTILRSSHIYPHMRKKRVVKGNRVTPGKNDQYEWYEVGVDESFLHNVESDEESLAEREKAEAIMVCQGYLVHHIDKIMRSKCTDIQIKMTVEYFYNGMTIQQICDKYEVRHMQVYSAIHGQKSYATGRDKMHGGSINKLRKVLPKDKEFTSLWEDLQKIKSGDTDMIRKYLDMDDAPSPLPASS